MTKIIPFEGNKNVKITEFRRSPKGKNEKVIRYKDWKGDPKRLRREAEKP